jgi:hypothetical protein
MYFHSKAFFTTSLVLFGLNCYCQFLSIHDFLPQIEIDEHIFRSTDTLHNYFGMYEHIIYYDSTDTKRYDITLTQSGDTVGFYQYNELGIPINWSFMLFNEDDNRFCYSIYRGLGRESYTIKADGRLGAVSWHRADGTFKLLGFNEEGILNFYNEKFNNGRERIMDYDEKGKLIFDADMGADNKPVIIRIGKRWAKRNYPK